MRVPRTPSDESPWPTPTLFVGGWPDSDLTADTTDTADTADTAGTADAMARRALYALDHIPENVQ